MATFKRGNMWNGYKHCDAFCITTNSYIKNDGTLVMGRGIAKVARDLLDMDEPLGERIQERCGHLGIYGILPADPENSRITAFQVKKHFKDDASTNLIQHSANKLNQVATKHSDRRFDLNFPGIGNGNLDVEQVRPIVEELPDNVNIWRFRNE